MNEIWKNTIDNLSSIIDEQGLIFLRSFDLLQENDRWYLLAPNIYVVDTIKKKYFNSIQLALEKAHIKNVEFKVGMPDLFQQKAPKNTEQNFASNLNPEYRFDTFVCGDSNKIAYSACENVAKQIHSDYNPLLIYGGTGLGKSHLMHAVGNALKREHPDIKILYQTAEQFVNEFIYSINNKKGREFSEYYRSVDALLIDDIQFLANKEGSQKEFFHTFNTLINVRHQVILTCDRFPKEINGIEDRLKSRFGAGLCIAINPPEFETRVAILKSKAETLQFHLPDEVAFFIAQHVKSNVRDLEGALKKVYAISQFNEQTPDIAMAKSALQDFVVAQQKQISIENIQKTVAEQYSLQSQDLISNSRKSTVVLPRQIAMTLAKDLTKHSYAEIGDAFGGRDHTTVMHAYKKVQKKREEDHYFNELYTRLQMILTG